MLMVIKQHRFLSKTDVCYKKTTSVFKPMSVLKTDVVLLPATSIFTKTDVNIDIQYRFLLKIDVVFIY